MIKGTKGENLYFVNPLEFKKGLYMKMEAFFNAHIKPELPPDKALKEVRDKMEYVFSLKDVHWFFNLYEPFPEWTPMRGWSILGRELYKLLIKE